MKKEVQTFFVNNEKPVKNRAVKKADIIGPNSARRKENNPNAKLFIYALRHLGYDNYSALCYIIDNAIDAGATKIQVYIESDNKGIRIIIVDNGCGMDIETLDEALRTWL